MTIGGARWPLLAVLGLAFLLPPDPASANLALSEDTVTTKTTTFRALLIDDVSGESDSIGIQGYLFTDDPFDDSGALNVRLFITASNPITAVPAACGHFAADLDLNGTLEKVGALCPQDYFEAIAIAAGAGNDRVRVEYRYRSLNRKQIGSPSHAVFMNVSLGPGRDRFRGGRGTDFIQGQGGSDRLYGSGADDVLIGGPGRDGVFGGDGRDLLLGGPGPDVLRGGRGTPDVMIAGPGRDLCAGSQRDRVAGCEKLKFASG